LIDGLAGTAVSLTQQGIGTGTWQLAVPGGASKVALHNNNLGEPLQNAVNDARGRPDGVYLLPSLPNFPVVDSLYISPTYDIKIQTNAGRSKALLTASAVALSAIVPGCLLIVVPDEHTMRKKLPGGPTTLEQYRLVLNEL
jgi:hypothetical protein